MNRCQFCRNPEMPASRSHSKRGDLFLCLRCNRLLITPLHPPFSPEQGAQTRAEVRAKLALFLGDESPEEGR